MNGNHRPEGVFFLSIPANTGAVQIQDVAPTVLTMLGVPCPGMDGVSLVDVNPDGQLTGLTESGGSARAYSPEESKKVEDRLRALGYFE